MSRMWPRRSTQEPRRGLRDRSEVAFGVGESRRRQLRVGVLVDGRSGGIDRASSRVTPARVAGFALLAQWLQRRRESIAIPRSGASRRPRYGSAQCQNDQMDRALHVIAAALADVDEADLRALIRAINRDPHTAPGVLAAIDGIPPRRTACRAMDAAACHWELHRRQGRGYELQPACRSRFHQREDGLH